MHNIHQTDPENNKIAQLEEECRKLKATKESQDIEIEVLKATLTHYENSIFHKMRDTYFKFKTKFQKKISAAKSSENTVISFIKICFNFTLTVAKVLFKKIYFYIYRKEFHLRKNDKYDLWRAVNMPKENDFILFERFLGNFSYRPLISVVMPVYNPPVKYFEKAIESVIDQLYPNWELCISDDNSTDPEIRKTIEKFCDTDPRIKVVYRTQNGHISANSNSALTLATGEFIALLDHDDLLTKDALFQVVFELNIDKNLDFIYTDEDKVDDYGNFTQPHFKPDYCPDNLLSRNYITHLAVIRHEIIKRIGGFREGFEGSQDYDLFHRVVEQTKAIFHIPKVLYHWRLHLGSASQGNEAKPYAYAAGKKAVMETLEKRGEAADVDTVDNLPGYYSVRYHLKKADKVSIIIPTKNRADILQTCIDSIFKKSTYRNFEIILLDNNSDEKSLFSLTDRYKKLYPEQFKYLRCEYAFNYSKLMNDGAKLVTGEYILLLNNDMEIITPNWMELLMGYAQRKSTGCVGAKLLFFNNTIQHAGVIMGLGGLAGHSFLKDPAKANGYYGYLKVSSNYSAVTAACLMVRKEVFFEVDGFDESLAVEYNDVDFCLKVREKGYDNVFLSEVQLYHYESLSRGNPLVDTESMKRHVKEVNILKTRWQKYIKHDPCYSPNLSLHHPDFRIKTHY